MHTNITFKIRIISKFKKYIIKFIIFPYKNTNIYKFCNRKSKKINKIHEIE